jgi:TRAP-type mannitol/chloroaromatic compound transport system permease large subunit
VLAVIGLCAFALDAFEIIFVIIPIVIPALRVRVADARWVSVLVLLTLQSSFLLPPFGYALMMVRGAARNPASFRALVRALAPFLIAQWLLLILVLYYTAARASPPKIPACRLHRFPTRMSTNACARCCRCQTCRR